MRAINAAYRLLSDPSRRAVYDAQRFLHRSPVVTYAPQPRPRPVVTVATAPTPLQRRVDRVVAVVGVILLIAIGLYTVTVIPYAERQFKAETDPRSAPLPRLAPPPPPGPPGVAHATAPPFPHVF